MINDYDVEMLRLYFLEKGYNSSQINNILNSNPFNEYYLNWEKEHLYSNKILAKYLILNGYVHSNDKLYELAFNEKNTVSRFLKNDKCLIKSSTNYRPNIHIPEEYTTLLVQPVPEMERIIIGLYKRKKSFIIGACTKDNELYEKKLEKLLILRNELKNTELCTSNYENHKICTLRKVYKKRK